MRSRTLALVLSGVALLGGLCCPVGGRAQEFERVLFYDTPYPPYILGEEGGGAPEGGTAVRAVREIFRRLDIPVDIEIHPWRRVLKSLEEGRCDGVILLMYSQERETFLCYTNRLCVGREMFYYRPEALGDFAWEEFTDLRGLRIGLVAGFTYGEGFLAAVDDLGLEVVHADDSTANFTMLNAGRVDLVLEEQAVAQSLLHGDPDWNQAIKEAAKPVTTYEYFMAFSRASGACALVDEVNRVMEEMTQDGTLDTILGTVP